MIPDSDHQASSDQSRSNPLIVDQLASEIKTCHYSPKTLKAYRVWICQFQTFTKSKDYQKLSQYDVVDFLSFLAVKK